MMVILFDDECNLCNGFVQFLIKRDSKNIFSFASLNSEYGTGLKKHFKLNINEKFSVIFYDGKNIFQKSRAIITIFYHLGGFWKSVTWLKIIPEFLADALYNLISKYRYFIFGKAKSCIIADRQLLKKFIDKDIFTPLK